MTEDVVSRTNRTELRRFRELSYLSRMEAIATTAIEWRKALYGGRYEKAVQHLDKLADLIDQEIRSDRK